MRCNLQPLIFDTNNVFEHFFPKSDTVYFYFQERDIRSRAEALLENRLYSKKASKHRSISMSLFRHNNVCRFEAVEFHFPTLRSIVFHGWGDNLTNRERKISPKNAQS